MSGRHQFTSLGKEVLVNDQHFADFRTNEDAQWASFVLNQHQYAYSQERAQQRYVLEQVNLCCGYTPCRCRDTP